uniref:Phosphopantothenoylcysteine decarboxylase n=1 Tax=Strigamia maritima TaxID=126957 RepID=T1IWE8_STRMM
MMEKASTSSPEEITDIKPYRVLIGCTGSVASVKIPKLVDELIAVKLNKCLEIQILSTEHSLHFFDPSTLPVRLYRDKDEWDTWKTMKDPVLHIELRRWADLFVIAPLDANTLAKMANGMCDNLITCVARAWDPKKPLLFCPAMNTFMWEHPLTAVHIDNMKKLGYVEIPVVKKTLACGDTGYGAMAEVSTIVSEVVNALGNKM